MQESALKNPEIITAHFSPLDKSSLYLCKVDLNKNLKYLSRVFIFPIVCTPYNGLLFPHPGFSLISISKVLLSLQGILQVLPTLRCFGFQRVPLLVQLVQFDFHILSCKVSYGTEGEGTEGLQQTKAIDIKRFLVILQGKKI